MYCETQWALRFYTSSKQISGYAPGLNISVKIAIVSLEAEQSSVGDVGISDDAGVLDAVCEWLWAWWRPSCSDVGQVQKYWETSVYSAVIGVLVVASDSDWMDGIPNSKVGTTSAAETDWTWVHTFSLADLHICTRLVVIGLCTSVKPKYLYRCWCLIPKYLYWSLQIKFFSFSGTSLAHIFIHHKRQTTKIFIYLKWSLYKQ